MTGKGMMTVCAAALAAGAVFAKTEWRTDLVGRTLTMTDREANAWAEALAADYPGLVRIGSLGESREGRRMTLLTVTDFSTGAAEEKLRDCEDILRILSSERFI